MKARRTRQLDAVYEVLRVAADHPTAAQVYDRVKRFLPRVSLGTVYRNLEKLAAGGRAVPVHLGDKATHYDATVTQHDHFVCRRCGRITDLAEGMQPDVDTRRLEQAGYRVDARRLAVLGTCRPCERKNLSRLRSAEIANLS